MKLCRNLVGGDGNAHVFAILKRCITVIAGKHALCIRFPSQDGDALMHRVPSDNIAGDWLQPPNNIHYSRYKHGVDSYPDDWDEQLEKEKVYAGSVIAARGR